jgi:hypothetical protein
MQGIRSSTSVNLKTVVTLCAMRFNRLEFNFINRGQISGVARWSWMDALSSILRPPSALGR